MDNSINVEVKLTTEDVYNFQKSYFLQRFTPLKLALSFIFIIVLAFSNFYNSFNAGDIPIGGILLILIPVAIIISIPILLKKSSKNALETNKLLQKTQKHQIDSEGIEVSSESSKVFIKWNELYKAAETKDSFQFYLSKQQAYIIPKRQLNRDTAQYEQLRKFMSNAPVPMKDKKSLLSKSGKAFLTYLLLFIIILLALMFFQE